MWVDPDHPLKNSWCASEKLNRLNVTCQGRSMMSRCWRGRSAATELGLNLYQLALSSVIVMIGGHKPPGHNPPVELEHNCTLSFSVTGKGVLKARFQDWRT